MGLTYERDTAAKMARERAKRKARDIREIDEMYELEAQAEMAIIWPLSRSGKVDDIGLVVTKQRDCVWVLLRNIETYSGFHWAAAFRMLCEFKRDGRLCRADYFSSGGYAPTWAPAGINEQANGPDSKRTGYGLIELEQRGNSSGPAVEMTFWITDNRLGYTRISIDLASIPEHLREHVNVSFSTKNGQATSCRIKDPQPMEGTRMIYTGRGSRGAWVSDIHWTSWDKFKTDARRSQPR